MSSLERRAGASKLLSRDMSRRCNRVDKDLVEVVLVAVEIPQQLTVVSVIASNLVKGRNHFDTCFEMLDDGAGRCA